VTGGPEPQTLVLSVAGKGPVSGLLLLPREARALLVLGHGAGAGMRHPFMESLASGLGRQGIGTLRYQFPYMESGRGRPDPPALLESTVRAAVEEAGRRSELPLFAGGKSLGGRMTSNAQSRQPLPGVRGLVFYGFPLHPPGRPGIQRAAHLDQVSLPLLFLQGTRDDLADLTLITDLCRHLGTRATLHVVDGGDHSFHVLKRSGRTDTQAMAELVGQTERWISAVSGQPDAPSSER
jgi:uncharacterized protein